ncbi:MAG: hypothetical protein Q4C06_01040 [Bacillota bacterium]|nr:hypothetical protein [Bacillota bacterium]
MKKIFRTEFTKRDKTISIGGIGGALVCFLLGIYIKHSHVLQEISAEAWQEFSRWHLIGDCFIGMGFILCACVSVYYLIQNMKAEK